MAWVWTGSLERLCKRLLKSPHPRSEEWKSIGDKWKRSVLYAVSCMELYKTDVRYFQVFQVIKYPQTIVWLWNRLTGWMSSTPPASAAPFSRATLAWLASCGGVGVVVCFSVTAHLHHAQSNIQAAQRRYKHSLPLWKLKLCSSQSWTGVVGAPCWWRRPLFSEEYNNLWRQSVINHSV